VRPLLRVRSGSVLRLPDRGERGREDEVRPVLPAVFRLSDVRPRDRSRLRARPVLHGHLLCGEHLHGAVWVGLTKGSWSVAEWAWTDALTLSELLNSGREAVMTEQERISREALLRRAAALAGAVYVAPILTSSAAAQPSACLQWACEGGRKGDRFCTKWGGPSCRCVGGRCGRSPETTLCEQDDRCGQQQPCESAHFCDDQQYCACFVVANGGGKTECVELWQFCSDYPPCDRETGSSCPAGYCCMDTCCPRGICMRVCSTEASASKRMSRRATRPGPTL
jgi:hypothetical protein